MSQDYFDFHGKPSKKSKLQIEFEIFDYNNPRVWELFIKFAFEAIARGKKKLGVSLLIERIRWEVFITTKSQDEFKINNNHKAYYARKWARQFPIYAPFFSYRALKYPYVE